MYAYVLREDAMQSVKPRTLVSVQGSEIPLPSGLTHLQFRRFAGCPICNLHLRSIVDRHDEILAAGIREVVVFHSPAEDLQAYSLPFAVIADPTKKLYREFGVETSRLALLHPKTIAAIVAGSLRRLGPNPKAHAGRLGLPADFLIDETGQILASKHGTHAYDQWTVDELLAHANQVRLR
jgi:alkyl-hydroperoxide reductase/thiol specific antioxidant family protein